MMILASAWYSWWGWYLFLPFLVARALWGRYVASPTPAEPVRNSLGERRRPRKSLPLVVRYSGPLTENDLEELEGMFGTAGDNPADYQSSGEADH